jgi:putative transposase
MQVRKVTFRLYPNATELAALDEMHGLHCRVANALLEEHKRRYEAKEPAFNFSAMCKEITSWRSFASSLASLNAQSLQVTARRASLSFAAFFRRVASGEKAGYPRFKSRSRFAGQGYAGTEYGAVRLSGIGTVSMRGRARFAGTPKTAEVMLKGGQWFLSVTFDVADEQVARAGGKESMSFDWGIKTLLTQVVGDALTGSVETVNNPRWLRTKLLKIKDLQQGISLLEEASKKASGKASKFPVNEKLSMLYGRLRRLHVQVARQRQDFYHQLTAALVSRFGLIVTETLAVKSMVKAPKPKQAEDGTYLPNGATAKSGLSLSMLDGAPAALMQKLRYKAEEAGSLLMELPTKKLKPTQRCCWCGATHKMALSDRTYSCACGSVIDRDENAARTMSRYAAHGAWWDKLQSTENPAGTVGAVDGLCPS